MTGRMRRLQALMSPLVPRSTAVSKTADELEEDEDLGSVNDLVVSGINLAAGQTLTVTYMSDAQATAGDATFAVSFDGGMGPDEGFIEALPDLLGHCHGGESRFRYGAPIADG